ncbi:hypothetical protein EW146_g10335 [Bondarzewia mesenterica]|uniref:Uncharacterized protein n=1 Tax=Bondarzewia mesenterica TaxID=1095465 RepID=A0A4S4KY50_9AGAM|nr:hypothetical protein EW146_g10335 [Bondarzewia mesenterica]
MRVFAILLSALMFVVLSHAAATPRSEDADLKKLMDFRREEDAALVTSKPMIHRRDEDMDLKKLMDF